MILAGGKGKRISKYLKQIPKPLYNFSGKVFLQYLINNIAKYNINNIYIIAGHRGKKIYNKFHNTTKNFVKIKCIIEKQPLGTGGALNLIKKKISKNFLLFNGDSIFDIDINKFLSESKKNKISMAITDGKNYRSNNKLNNIDINQKKFVIKKKSKKINGGIYLLNKNIFPLLKKKCSLENDILPHQIDKKNVTGVYFKNFFIDIGTPKNLILAKKKIQEYFNRPAFFFDRDGTINEDTGYTHKLSSFRFQKNILNIFKLINKKKYYIFIVTNQSGIAKGYFTEKDFINLHILIKKKLTSQNMFIHDVMYCPYHPNAKLKKYKKNSGYRKPNNLMIIKLLKNWNINLKKSLMIGDQQTDEECAKKVN